MNFRALLLCGLVARLAAFSVVAQEAVMEEVRIEAHFDLKLEPPRARDVALLIDRLTVRAEMLRTAELQAANRTPLGALLELTRFSPIPLGGSDNRVDTFFLQNSMRPDLNPQGDSGLFRKQTESRLRFSE